jgi:flagellar assembly protein FliH
VAEKFLFDHDFDTGGSILHKRQKAEVYEAADLDAARAEALAEGERRGRQLAGQEVEAAASATLGMIASGIDECRMTLGDIEARQAREAAQVGIAIGRRLAETLITRFPEREIESLVTGCLKELRDEPRLVVRTSETVANNLRDRIDQMATGAGFAGRVVLLPDDTMGPQDARVEWADGGASRDHAATEAAIAEAVDRFLDENERQNGGME